jgi:hypothetical protein
MQAGKIKGDSFPLGLLKIGFFSFVPLQVGIVRHEMFFYLPPI